MFFASHHSVIVVSTVPACTEAGHGLSGAVLSALNVHIVHDSCLHCACLLLGLDSQRHARLVPQNDQIGKQVTMHCNKHLAVYDSGSSTYRNHRRIQRPCESGDFSVNCDQTCKLKPSHLECACKLASSYSRLGLHCASLILEWGACSIAHCIAAPALLSCNPSARIMQWCLQH